MRGKELVTVVVGTDGPVRSGIHPVDGRTQPRATGRRPLCASELRVGEGCRFAACGCNAIEQCRSEQSLAERFLWMDEHNHVLPDDDPYVIRLNSLSAGLTSVAMDTVPANLESRPEPPNRGVRSLTRSMAVDMRYFSISIRVVAVVFITIGVSVALAPYLGPQWSLFIVAGVYVLLIAAILVFTPRRGREDVSCGVIAYGMMDEWRNPYPAERLHMFCRI